MNRNAYLYALLLTFSALQSIHAAPLVVSDSRIRHPDVTPALGRGYSMTTSQVLSTCLGFTEQTVPTYNYDYTFTEFDQDGHSDSKVDASLSGSASYGFVSGAVTGSVKSHKETTMSTRHVVIQMSAERYYSSVDDTTAVLTPDALSLVGRGDLIGFFQSCGSGYIRSIRRTAEFTAVFTFSSHSEKLVKEAAASLKVKSLFGPKFSADFKSKSSSMSEDVKTTISIKAFGIGLDSAGADTLVATDRKSFDAATKYAFKSMQQPDVGMVRGVEIVPWSSNLQFNNAVQFDNQEKIELDASGQRKSTLKRMDCTAGCPTDPLVAGVCTAPGPDDQCIPVLPTTGPSPQPLLTGNQYHMVARPDIVHAIEVKAITMINAEFITALESIFTNQMYMQTTMQACATTLNQLKTKENGKYLEFKLRDHSRMHMDPNKAGAESMTVKYAASQLTADVLHDQRTSNQNFVKHFYGPCATKISEHSNNGKMTKYWWDFDECMPKTATSSTGPTTATTECLQESGHTYDVDKASGKFTCKEDQKLKLADGTTGYFGLDIFVMKFCMPEIDEHAT